MPAPDCPTCGASISGKPRPHCLTPSGHQTPEWGQVWVKIGRKFELRGTGVIVQPE